MQFNAQVSPAVVMSNEILFPHFDSLFFLLIKTSPLVFSLLFVLQLVNPTQKNIQRKPENLSRKSKVQ